MLHALTLIISLAAPAPRQAARIGRLPVLAPPPANARSAENEPSRQLKRDGIERMFRMQIGATNRLISLGLGPSGRPRLLTAMMSTTEKRRSETESVNVLFGDSGEILSGDHKAFTGGTPSARSEDRRGNLLPGDTAQVRALVREIMKMCRA
jgi:hypothetical protein